MTKYFYDINGVIVKYYLAKKAPTLSWGNYTAPMDECMAWMHQWYEEDCADEGKTPTPLGFSAWMRVKEHGDGLKRDIKSLWEYYNAHPLEHPDRKAS